MLAGCVVRATAFVAVAVLGVSGCSGSDKPQPSVSSAELQKSLVEQLTQAGTPSTWVNCPKDLPGRVGATTRCEVRFSQDNSVTALLTTTEVDGGRIAWEITGPELTKDQVTKRIAAMTSAQSATCDSGLDGRPGDWVVCHVTRNGVALNQVAEIKDVRGLAVDLTVTPAIPQQQLEDLVLGRVAPLYGRRPERAQCEGDLPGTLRATVACTVTVGGKPDKYIATVTGVPGGFVNFDVTRASGT